MKNVYSIGRFRFDSYAEYKKGLADVKKIKCISSELDINEPGVALRLYTLVRQQDIKFQSVIGEDYLLYLSDLVADDYKEIADRKDNYLAVPGRAGSFRKAAGILCIIAAILCFAYFIGSEYIRYQKTREIKELQESKDVSRTAQYIVEMYRKSVETESEDTVENTENATQPKKKEEKKEQQLTILPDYVGLKEQNEDMAGWLTIPGTEINYPVLQSKDNPDFYLSHNFDKKEDINGSIFMDTRNNYVDRDTNLIIYGHNMKNGLMFGSLHNYLDETYWKEHKTIQFNTLYQKDEYDIVAVCLAEVAYQEEDVFRYYNYLNAESKEAFQVFKDNIAQLNLYGKEVDISFEDEVLTLSTCNNYVEDGRLFLIGKKINQSEAGQ